jgi:hypothetical protein
MRDRACEMSILLCVTAKWVPLVNLFNVLLLFYFVCTSSLPGTTATSAHIAAGRSGPTCARAPSAGLLGTRPTQTSASPLAGRRRPPAHASPPELVGRSSRGLHARESLRPCTSLALIPARRRPCSPSWSHVRTAREQRNSISAAVRSVLAIPPPRKQRNSNLQSAGRGHPSTPAHLLPSCCRREGRSGPRRRVPPRLPVSVGGTRESGTIEEGLRGPAASRRRKETGRGTAAVGSSATGRAGGVAGRRRVEEGGIANLAPKLSRHAQIGP